MSPNPSTTLPPVQLPASQPSGGKQREIAKRSDQALDELLATFNASHLGEGDTNTGANVLGAMLGVLANLAPTDGTILTRDGRPARLGVNLLISGSSSCGRVLDEVIAEVGHRQRNLATNLSRYLDCINEQKQKPGASLPPTGPGVDSLVEAIAMTQSDIEPLFSSRTAVWSRILNEVSTEQVTDLARCPKFLVSLTRPDDLEKQLQGLRPGHPLVHLCLGQPGDLGELAIPVAALVEGRFTLGPGGETARANLLITDPLQMLAEAAKVPDVRTAWLGHLLWLCDGEAGPEAPTAIHAPDFETTTERFRRALDHVITRRLNLPEKKPSRLRLDTREATIRWTGFLREMEPRLPGISGAARNLIASLVFGLGEMARIEKPITFSIAGVEAFARFLVRRMANARTLMMHAGEVARRRSQIERVFRKLEKGPIDARKIYRDLSHLPPGDCHACLRWMEQTGIARRSGEQWELVEEARLSFNDRNTPLLEV